MRLANCLVWGRQFFDPVQVSRIRLNEFLGQSTAAVITIGAPECEEPAIAIWALVRVWCYTVAQWSTAASTLAGSGFIG